MYGLCPFFDTFARKFQIMSEATNYIENLLKEFGNRDVNAFIDTAAEDISSM